MLERYKDSLSDLVHLLKVDPKNFPEFQFPMKLKDLEFHAVFLQVLVFSKKLENKGYYFLYGRFQNNLLITEQKSCENS